MPDAQIRTSVIEETLALLGTDAPYLRSRVEFVIDRLPHIFSYAEDQRPQLVRYHVLRLLKQAS